MLAVALKRRLLLLHFNGNEFTEAKELGLPDVALALGWCGSSVCLGFRRECGPHLSMLGLGASEWKTWGCLTQRWRPGTSPLFRLKRGDLGKSTAWYPI